MKNYLWCVKSFFGILVITALKIESTYKNKNAMNTIGKSNRIQNQMTTILNLNV